MDKTVENNLKEKGGIIKYPQKGVASDLYWACRGGDTEYLEAMLPNIPYDQLNQLEPNGSTALHVATFYCHTDIVSILLHEYGVERHHLNLHGKTAFEEAQSDEMKQLYQRPLNRFCDEHENSHDTFDILSVKSYDTSTADSDSTDEDDNDETKDEKNGETPAPWIQVYKTKEEMDQELYYCSKGKSLIQSRFARFIMRNGPKFCSHCKKNKEVMQDFISYFNDPAFRASKLQTIIDNDVTSNHPYYNKCQRLLRKYSENQCLDSLIKLYTLETPFYKKIRKSCQAMAWSLYVTLPSLQQRFFKGTSYRGLLMSNEDIDVYRSALETPDHLIKTKTFSSSSITRNVAEKFARGSIPDKLSVLMIFNFPEFSDMAINLSNIPEKQLRSLSEYESENEVLILPLAFFRIKSIEFNNDKHQYEIFMENIVLKKAPLLSALKFMIFREEEPKLIHYYTKTNF